MQDQILFPMGALAFLTFAVLLFIPIRHFRVTVARVVRPRAHAGRPAMPRQVVLANRNYMDLLAMPMLFYVVCVMFHITARVDRSVLDLAWVYVGLRVLHSAIHITYNTLSHRMSVFALSNLILIWLWVMFFVNGA